jgi:subtilisin family serine protease
MELPANGAPGRHEAKRKVSKDRRGLIAAGIGGLALTVVATIAAWPAAAAPLTGEIHGDSDGAVADSYIVVLKNSVPPAGVSSTADDMTSKYGGRVGHRYSSALRGFEVNSMSEDKAAQLAADPTVSYVQRNEKLSASDVQQSPPSWGLDRIDQQKLPLDKSFTYPNTAPDVHAYIIDSGIRFSQQDFGGRATSGYDFVDNDADASDCSGHGTHVAGTVGGNTYGVAKQVQLVSVRVLDCNGDGDTASVTAGVDWVTAHAQKPAVANISIGGDADQTLDNAVINSINSGVTYSIAAGNGNGADACSYSPSRVGAAITVAATDQTDTRAKFSNVGSCVDLFAPGSRIISDSNASDTATVSMSGTSMAAPHVTGAAALLLEANRNLTPQQVRDKLVLSASDAVNSPGDGSPTGLLYIDNSKPATDFAIGTSPDSVALTAGDKVSTTVGTKLTAGSGDPVTLSVSGVPAGVDTNLSATQLKPGDTATLTVSTASSLAAGNYPITVTGTAGKISHSATFTLSVTALRPPPSASCTATNGTDIAIPDAGAAVTSDVTIANCTHNPGKASVYVHIVHPFRGDLRIDLQAPDGTLYRLKNPDANDGGVDVDTTFSADVTGQPANGVWSLRVQDMWQDDAGTLDSWTLTY